MTADEHQELNAVLDRLHQRFEHLDSDAIESTLRRVHQRFEGHPIRDFVPLLVERGAIVELRSHGEATTGDR